MKSNFDQDGKPKHLIRQATTKDPISKQTSAQ